MPIREDWLADRHSLILNTWNNLVLMELLKYYSRLWFSILDRSPYPFHSHFVSSPRWRSRSRALIMMLKRPLHSPRNVIERGDIKNRACQIRLQPFVPKKNSPSKLFIRHLVNKSSLFGPLRFPGRRPNKWLIKTLPCVLLSGYDATAVFTGKVNRQKHTAVCEGCFWRNWERCALCWWRRLDLKHECYRIAMFV